MLFLTRGQPTASLNRSANVAPPSTDAKNLASFVAAYTVCGSTELCASARIAPCPNVRSSLIAVHDVPEVLDEYTRCVA